MNEMVERVATVLAQHDGNYPWALEDGHVMQGRKDYYFKQARAAIVAMREPTPEMLKAHDQIMGSGWDNHCSDKELWQAMIDEALK
jgi:hypothetical protein